MRPLIDFWRLLKSSREARRPSERRSLEGKPKGGENRERERERIQFWEAKEWSKTEEQKKGLPRASLSLSLVCNDEVK